MITTEIISFIIPQPTLALPEFQTWMLENVIQEWLFQFEHNELPNVHTPRNKPGFVAARFNHTYARCALTLYDGTQAPHQRGITFHHAERPYPKDLTAITESFEAFLKCYRIDYRKA